MTYSQKPDRVDGKLIILIIRHDFKSKVDFNELFSLTESMRVFIDTKSGE